MSDRTYGELSYGSGTYGGPDPTWDSLQGPVGPPGDSDLSRYLPVSARINYQGGYIDYPGFGSGIVYRDRQGMCWLNTTINTPASPAAGAIPAYLPPGFWPLNRIMFPIHYGAPEGVGRLDINQDGALQLGSAPQTGSTYLIIDAVWYSAVPTLAVLDGLAVTSVVFQSGTTYLVSYTAGRLVDLNGVIYSVPAGTSVAYVGAATGGFINVITITTAGVLGSTLQSTGVESTVMIDYYSQCNAAYSNRAILSTFYSGAGARPAADRRWLPYV